MTNLMRRAYISMRTRAEAFAEELRSDERGVSAIVATILIMLIVVLLVAVFWEKLSSWFTEIMNKIFGEADPSKFNKPTVN